MEFLELVTTQLFASQGGNPINNVFRYRSASSLEAPNSFSAALIDAFLNDPVVSTPAVLTLGQVINALQSNQMSNVSVTARNLYNPLDFAEAVWPGGGITTDPGLPSISTVSFRAARARQGRNRWRKRFSGVPEGAVSGNTIAGSATYLASLDDAALAFESVLTGTAQDVERAFVPIVLYSVAIDTPNGRSYRLPFTALEAESLNDAIQGVTWSDQISTQTTRRSNPRYQ